MKEIIKGWANYAKKTEIEQKKLDACNGCEHNIDAPIKFLKVKDDNPIISEKVCGKCLCPLPTFLRSDEKCKMNKF